MKGKFSKKLIASGLAVMMASSCPTALSGFASASAEGVELPIIRYDGKVINTYTFTNNTDFVEAYQNGKLLKTGDTVTDEYDIVMTSLSPFTYTVNGSMYPCNDHDRIMNSYMAECTPYGDFTVEKDYRRVQHEDGFYGVSNSYIFLWPGNFYEKDMFYFDKSIKGDIFGIQRNGRTVSFRTALDYPVSVYYADSQEELKVTHDSTTFTNTVTLSSADYSGKLIIVRKYSGPSVFDPNQLPFIPDDTVTVTHCNGMGEEEKIELGKGFAKSGHLLEVDGAFSKSEVLHFARDLTTGTGIVSVRPGTNFSVYDIFGGKAKVTKLGSSDSTRDIYSFEADGTMTYFLVKEKAKPAAKYLRGDINSDGKVDVMDLVLLKQRLSGRNVDLNKNAADINGDGKINTTDASVLEKYLSGAISQL